MHTRTTRLPLYAAGLTAILVTALTACGSAPGATSTSTAAAATPLDEVRLAAQTSNAASSFTGTLSLRATAKTGRTGSLTLIASFAEQLRPSVLVQINVQSMSASGVPVPGGMTEIISPATLYLKWSYLTQLLHTAKPWLKIPLSTGSKSSGVNLSQIFSQATRSSPLTESQLLAGATSVQKVGTGIVAGDPVTEYTGTLPLDKGATYLPASVRRQVLKELSAAGFTTAAFTVWIDGKNTVRKSIITEHGTALSETATTTITSMNQPVNVQIPAASQSSSLPAGGLGSLG